MLTAICYYFAALFVANVALSAAWMAADVIKIRITGNR